MPRRGRDDNNINVYRSNRGRDILLNQNSSDADLRNNAGFDEPSMLSVITSVVFDQVGINLCRFIPFPEDMLSNYPEAATAILEVVDIDFTQEGVSTRSFVNSPYCVRILLSDLMVTFSAKLLDCRGRFIDNILFRALYLDSNPNNECYNEESNPSQVALDLYAPYGTSYRNTDSGNSAEPVIQFLGFSTRNNLIPQGIVIQALAKVLDFNWEMEGMNIGLTLNIESVYDIQYKIPHGGVSVPPKAEPAGGEVGRCCLDFIEGGLLERDIKPLDLGDAVTC